MTTYQHQFLIVNNRQAQAYTALIPVATSPPQVTEEEKDAMKMLLEESVGLTLLVDYPAPSLVCEWSSLDKWSSARFKISFIDGKRDFPNGYVASLTKIIGLPHYVFWPLDLWSVKFVGVIVTEDGPVLMKRKKFSNSFERVLSYPIRLVRRRARKARSQGRVDQEENISSA